MSKTATKLSKEDIMLEDARRYLADRAFRFVLGKSQASKLRQVMKGVEIDGITMRLVRDVMAASDKFETVDRRWSASARYGNAKRPLERVLAEVIRLAGAPLSLEALAGELAQVYGRAAEHYEQALPRVISDADKFFRTPQDTYGVTEWLLIPTSANEDDVLFDNFISDEEVEEYSKLCPTAKWAEGKEADTAAELVKTCKSAVPVKILALFAWREYGGDFDPVDFYSKIISDERLVVLSDQKAYPAEASKDWQKALAKAAEELAELPMEAEEEEAEGPVAITDTDKEEIVTMILDRGSADAAELLEAILEIGPGEPAFAGTLELLNEALKCEDRVMWIGGTRWSKVETFPDEVTVIPDSLIVPPTTPFETPEGDVYDQELESEGFDGDLKSAIYDPLVEDVTDEDPALTNYQPNGDSQRCVLKYHHKVEGTFPLCQINPEFFGTEPEIIPIVLVDEGKRKQAYVNNSTRLIYGLKDFYKDITEVSGAVFYIEKTAKPGEYRFKYDGEVDETLGIDTDRSLELLEVKARFESQEMPLHDAIINILEQSKQGMTFAQLVNEVNIAKRCSRLVVASILSGYHAFHTRGKSSLWQFDEKKASQGFNKAKRKYIKKD